MIEAMIGEHYDVAHYRVIVPAYAGTPMSGMGAARRGGRGVGDQRADRLPL